MNVLDGWKTYIVAGIMILLALAKGQGWISADTYWEINSILVAFGLSFLRAGSKSDADKATSQIAQVAQECMEKK